MHFEPVIIIIMKPRDSFRGEGDVDYRTKIVLPMVNIGMHIMKLLIIRIRK